ncbi:MAG TPA: general secretion pathway protein GspD [Planctomycetaceae bacterium]|nr:general secretion pathway protein GspD [Planctomycetaceae bacterium]
MPGETSPASPAGASAATLFQKGEEALRSHNVDEALNYYRQAAQYREQLDPETAGQLQARLQALSTPAPAAGPSGSLPDEAMAKQQLLVKTISSDVANQERRALQLRESDPKRALTLLGQARMTVEKSGLDENSKGALLRRVDRNIAEMTQYVEDNRFQIELTERNDQTRDQIDREQQHTLDVQQQLKELVDRCNQLNEEQRFHEAEVVAKQAYEIAPNEQIAQQLLLNQKFLRRIMENRRLANEKEEGYIAAMLDVDRASIPFDTSKSIVFPDAREWRDITDSRSRFTSDAGRERTGKELEIEQKLRTPVSLRFTDAPLSLVLDQLQELAQISIHIDPQGLQEEGIASSTPVTINLRDEVSLKSALNLILQPLHLGYVIEDEVLKITSEQYKNKEVYTRVYDVGDLVIPIPNFIPNSRMGLAGAYNDAMGRAGFNNTTILGATPPVGLVADASAGGMTNPAVLAQMAQPGARGAGSMAGGPAMGGFGPGGLGGGSQAEFGPLIDLIMSTVKYNTWQEYGGEGLIDSYENNLTLVITNTEEVHAEVVKLLEQLRRLQDLQVTIEVRFITLNDDFFESIRVDFDLNVNDRIDPVRRNLAANTAANAGDDDDDDDTPTVTGKQQIRDAADGRSVTVGLTAPGVFAADLDIPFTQGSYDLAVPQFGGFDASAGASLGFAVLSNIEAFFFINAAQGDSRTNILQAPKVTLFNGQTAYVNDTSQSPFVMGLIPVVGDFAAAQQPVIVILSEGTFMTVQAVVSHDRRFVRLTVIPFFSQIGKVNTFTFQGTTSSTVDTSTEGNTTVPDDSTKENNVLTTETQGTTVQLPTYSSISVSTTVSVPDGGTVLLGGIKRLSEGRSEYGTPILNKIPYINRLFKNVGIGRETQSLMMTVTPRIIIQEEEEERIGAGPLRP